ncbi:alanyl aminopeptidase. Metallo peptidase. MEROPS family M01 [Lampropedia hyalina DSM 16112]|jgi:aminopeptidase N|uniref:Aminopeptidase N n=1 Tax=Lampropedia hyalina DSM 16112 TaxID=1122156 RepID=A0A1M5CP26_9BURK|nr:aminopeptidase N [Lampropedia hyalina]SHF56172.1 alanyl aminopeptidase. Metallo peptidase. MEROPS family M01 [Lampropedia hyalina DSM 16112]
MPNIPTTADAISPPEVRRQDYAPPAWWIDTVDLTFDLDPAKTRVLNKMRLRRNPDVPVQPLRLDGDSLNLARVLVNGQGASFKLEGQQLVLSQLPEGDEAVELEIFTTCQPEKNTLLSGLFVSQGTFFTQCEAEGFRRITYFLDRPDVMSIYSVTLRASKAAYPVLLSNGNLVEQGDLDDGRHFARWHDPFRKPSYLFALVAGTLVAREQAIRARNGKEHLLQVYVRPGDLEKTEHAMQSLIASIVWDETRFGLPLDLDRFMIVATSDFNMGAMENKGLNIFNTKFVLASQATATDVDFANVESVVGHEYFHNWTGNRITCRDWFQLSLKEGLTVFRDQEFSMDMAGSASARAVKRIEDVRLLRTVQFAEDAGPQAHPVRPDAYQEINNFYTVTIYEKGAEVVRMMHTLVGEAGFQRGMKLYFERHDGQAVTCDDFAQAIADANPDSPLAQHLEPFKRWYSQAGTPHVHASGHYDSEQQTYTLHLTQSLTAPPGQPDRQAAVIPVKLGLLQADGQPVPLWLQTDDGEQDCGHEHTLVLHQSEQRITFGRIPQPPVPSLLRSFSAPVVLHQSLDDDALETLLQHDSDPFNRWEAGQQWAQRVMLEAIRQPHTEATDAPARLPERLVAALRQILREPQLDAAFKDLVLTLPSENYLAEQLDTVDPQRIHAVRQSLQQQLAQALHDDWRTLWEQHHDTGAYRPDAHSSGRRALAGKALFMLCLHASHTGEGIWPGKAYQQSKDANNMTDRFNALLALVHTHQPLAEAALARFHQQFHNEALVLDKWFSLQASVPDRQGDILPAVQQLMQHPDFTLKNPNRARSLIFTLCNANPAAFHRADGAGYQFWADQVIALNGLNAQVAARLARSLDAWRKLAEPYRSHANAALQRVASQKNLSKDVREIIEKSRT